MLHYFVLWDDKGTETTNKYLNFSRKLYEGMTPLVSKSPKEAFQNYKDLDIGAKLYGSKYFKCNFGNLIKVYQKVKYMS